MKHKNRSFYDFAAEHPEIIVVAIMFAALVLTSTLPLILK